MATQPRTRRASRPRGKRLTMGEIERKCDGEWVLLVDPEYARGPEILSAELAAHSKDRDVISREAVQRGERHTAMLYIGEVPSGIHFLL